MGKIVLPSLHPFAGIAEKLNRSHENICNLESEIATFFKESEYPILTYDDQKVILEAVEYHRDLPIPLRFRVLSGEIVHHLRSCLDHIVWHFSDAAFREEPKNRRYIEFPILDKPPSDVFSQYERKIKGIINTAVRSLIDDCQPYKRRNPNESLLLAIHNMDIIDKHKELVIVASTGAFSFPIEILSQYEGQNVEISTVLADIKQHGKLVPEIAFGDFCGAESETVVQALGRMHNEVIRLVRAFDKLL